MGEPYSSVMEKKESVLMVGREEHFSAPEYLAAPGTS